MNEKYKFYIGISLIIIGVVYVIWNLKKENYDNNDYLKKADSVNSWVIALVLIGSGIVMLFWKWHI